MSKDQEEKAIMAETKKIKGLIEKQNCNLAIKNLDKAKTEGKFNIYFDKIYMKEQEKVEYIIIVELNNGEYEKINGNNDKIRQLLNVYLTEEEELIGFELH
jgi:hypothetical protein